MHLVHETFIAGLIAGAGLNSVGWYLWTRVRLRRTPAPPPIPKIRDDVVHLIAGESMQAGQAIELDVVTGRARPLRARAPVSRFCPYCGGSPCICTARRGAR